jgi:hypothetical protein
MISFFIHLPNKHSSPGLHALLVVGLLALSLPAARAQAIFTGSAATESFGAQTIGLPSTPQALSFSIAAGTSVGSIAVVTTGIPNLDFASTTGTTCAAQRYSTAANCVVNVSFTPTAAGLRMGAVLFFSKSNGAGAVLGSVLVYGTGIGPQIAFGPGVVSAVDKPKYDVGLVNPVAMAADAAGNLFVLDTISNPPSYRLVQIPAGGGKPAVTYPAANGEALYLPSCIALDGAGDLFIGDFYGRIVEVSIGGAATTAIYPSANGIPLKAPSGLVVDGLGDLFVADYMNNRILELPAGGAEAIAIAPSANGIPISDPHGLALDAAGDLFIADLANDRVVELPAGGAPAVAIAPTVNGENLQNPVGVAVDAAGDLYIADNVNHRVVELPAGGAPATAIDPNTIFSGKGDVYGVTMDAAGDLFLVQEIEPGGPHFLEEVEHGEPALADFQSPTFLNSTDTSDGTQTMQAVNIGNQPLTLTALTYPADFSEPSGDANVCTSSTTLNPGQQCDVPIDFTPVTVGALSESITLTDDALNAAGGQQSIPVAGMGMAQTALVSPLPDSTLSGKNVTFSWTAVPAATQYYLWVGTTGVGSRNLMNTGLRKVTSWNVTGIPTNGETVYARLATYYGSIEMLVDYTFTASSPSQWKPIAPSPCLHNTNPGSLPPVQRPGGTGLISTARDLTTCPARSDSLTVPDDDLHPSPGSSPAVGKLEPW